MSATLVSITQPLIKTKDESRYLTAEEFISYCARVSNPSNQLNTETASRLLAYCIKHQHWSIFEQVSCTFEIKTSRAIAAQILRHRSFSFQEFCISGKSLITTIQPNGQPRYLSIEKLYERQHWKSYKKLNIRVYDDVKKEFTTSKIREVFKTGKKDCFKVYFNDGKHITCTKEHKFLTRDGFETLENALGLERKKNTVVLTNPKELAVNGIPCYQSKEWLEAAKIRNIKNGLGMTGIAKEANISYNTIKKWIRKHKLSFTKQETASYTTVWNKGKTGYKIKPRTKEQREYMSKITPKGEMHHSYKGGAASKRRAIANYFNKYRQDIFKKFNYTCQMCKRPFNYFDGKIDIHHIKEVGLFPELALDLDNVIPVHRKCHMEHHGKSYYFTETIRKSHKGNTLAPKFVKIEKVEYVGEIETYDLEVYHPSHNYVANKICVHNSQRYATTTELEDIEWRMQGKTNRQVGDEIIPLESLTNEQREAINCAQKWSTYAYSKLVEGGIAKECARMVLPLNTSTTLYMSGTARSWLHYLELRTKEDTQKEHRNIALEIQKQFKEHFPSVTEALGW
jgi:thymidylate synthase (FAD)